MLHGMLRAFANWQAAQVKQSMLHPRAAQQRAFQRIVRLLRGTVVAQRSGLDRCETLEDCRNLPVSSGDSMKPVFQELMARGQAARRLMGHTPLLGFARTSGTLGQPKDIPINKAYLDSLDRTVVRMVTSHMVTSGAWSTLLTGRRILLGSRPTSGTSPTGLPIGDISGIIPTRTWWSTRFAFIPRHRDLWMEDWSQKADLIVEQARGKNVVSISGIPALASDFAQRACRAYGVEHLGDAWPNLGQYVYGAVHLDAQHREELRRSWMRGNAPLDFFETYFASEGALAFSYEANVDGLALNSLENVYLFQAYDGDRRFLLAHELEPGHICSIHITTPGGLVNYQMGDRVEVVSTSPLRVRVVGREAEEISMTGEKITVRQVDLALDAAGVVRPAVAIAQPVVWAQQGGRPHLVWVLPQDAGSTPDAGCAQRLDHALCELNVLYAEALVTEKVIGPSQVMFKPAAAFVSQRAAPLGTGQFKARRLFNSWQECLAEYRWEETPPATGVDGSGGS